MNIPACAMPVLSLFQSAFSTPTYHRFLVLALAAVLTTGRRTVTNLLRIVRFQAQGHVSAYHRVLSQRRWSTWALARALITFLLDHVVPSGPVLLAGDVLFTDEAIDLLAKHTWPGNVRELENAIERAVVLGNSDVIMPDDLPETLLAVASASEGAPNFHEAVLEMKKQYVLRTLEQTSGNYTEAAKLLGIHPTNLHRLIRTLGLKK